MRHILLRSIAVLPSAGQFSCENLDLFNGVDLDTLIYKGKRKQYLDEQAIISDLTIVKFLLDENVTITILVRACEDLNHQLLVIPSCFHLHNRRNKKSKRFG